MRNDLQAARCRFSLRILKSLSILILFLSVCRIANAENQLPPDSFRNEVNSLMEMVIGFDFTATKRALESFGYRQAFMEREGTGIENLSAIPSAAIAFYYPFLTAYLDFWRYLLAPNDQELKSTFRDDIENAIKTAEEGEDSGNPDAMLFKSCAYLLLALFEAESGNPIPSGLWFIKGIQNANGIAETFPNADPYLIVGCYDYYRTGGKTGFQAVLEKAATEGFYFKELAAYMEGKLLQREDREWEYSAAIFQTLHRKYPMNSLFSFHLAKSLQHLGRFRESIVLYDYTLETAICDPIPVELLCVTHFSKGQILEFNLHDPAAAISSYRTALESADRSVKKSVWFIPWSLLHIGYCYERMGDAEKALSAFSAVSREDDREAWKRAQEAIERIHDR